MRGARRISFRGICRRHRFARRACCTAFSQSSTTPSCHWHASRSLRPTVTSRSSPASLRSPGPLHRTFPSPAPPRLATGTHIGHFARPTSLHCSRHRFARLPLSHRLFPAQHHPVLPLGRISVTSPGTDFFLVPRHRFARLPLPHRTFPSPAPPRRATSAHIGHFARPTSLHCSRRRFARQPYSTALFPVQHHPVVPLARMCSFGRVDSSFFRSPSESAARSRAGELSAPENRYPRSPRAPLPAAPSASPRRARTVR